MTIPIGMSRSVIGERLAAAGLALRVGGERAANARDDRPDDPQQRPDRRDADGPGADEADLVDEQSPMKSSRLVPAGIAPASDV